MEKPKVSICFHTEKTEECKSFYMQYFDAKITFDCGWYIDLTFCNTSLQFMTPQQGQETFNGKGITLNIKTDNVDSEYERLIKLGINIYSPIENHPWGDRSFSVRDPLGNELCLYREAPPSDEFKGAYVES